MSRKRSSKQLRNIVIAMILIIVFILIAFLIFIFNVDIKKSGTGIIDVVASNKKEDKEEAIVNGVIAPDELAGAEYESVAYDRENTFEVVTLQGKVYLKLLVLFLF